MIYLLLSNFLSVVEFNVTLFENDMWLVNLKDVLIKYKSLHNESNKNFGLYSY